MSKFGLSRDMVDKIKKENARMELVGDSTKKTLRKYVYEFEFKGYKCEVKRHPSVGHLCGYVVLKESDKFPDDFGVGLNVHGNITYTNLDELKIGFDCAHAVDMSPAYPHLGGEYRDLDYVISECKNLVNNIIKGEY